MSQVSKQSLIALALLAVTALGTLWMTQRDRILGRTQAAQGYEFVVDTDNWVQTDRQRFVRSPYDLRLGPGMDQIPLKLGDWQGEDLQETNQEVFILLQPEKMVYRRYTLPDGRFLWLTLLGSRQSRSFHSAQICYTADGWTTALDSTQIPLAGDTLTALKIRADKNPYTHVALYFFVFPNLGRNLNDGTVLFKVTAPLFGNEEETVALARQFIKEFFTSARG